MEGGNTRQNNKAAWHFIGASIRSSANLHPPPDATLNPGRLVFKKEIVNSRTAHHETEQEPAQTGEEKGAEGGGEFHFLTTTSGS